MAATLQQVNRTGAAHGGGQIKRVDLNWTSHTDGTVAIATDAVNGTILRVTFNPSSTAPTDNYDVTLTDEDGYDVLGGRGADRDTSTTESLCPGIPFSDGTTTSLVPVAVAGTLTLNVSNAGSGKSGTVTLYLR